MSLVDIAVVMAAAAAGRLLVVRFEGGAPVTWTTPVDTGADDPADEQEADNGSNDDASNLAAGQAVSIVDNDGLCDDGGGGLAGDDGP